MSAAKFRIQYEKAFKCRCGRWMARAGGRCTECAIRAEQKDATALRAKLRERLDPGPCDDYGRPAA